MTPPISIDGTDITGATIDGTDVQQITVDGQTVFTAGPPAAPVNRFYTTDFGDVYQYDTTNKFDLTGATKTGTLSVGFTSRDVQIANQGQDMYISGSPSEGVRYYTLQTAYDITSAQFVNFTSFPEHGVDISPDGTKMVAGSRISNNIEYYELSTPFDPQSATQQASQGGTQFADVDYENGGSLVTSMDDGTRSEFQLSTPHDFTTRGSVSTFSGFNTASRAQFMSPDGTKYFIGEFGNDTIIEFDLSTPFDVSNRTQVDQISVDGAGAGLDMV